MNNAEFIMIFVSSFLIGHVLFKLFFYPFIDAVKTFFMEKSIAELKIKQKRVQLKRQVTVEIMAQRDIDRHQREAKEIPGWFKDEIGNL